MVKISFLEWFAYIITIVGFIVMGIFLYHMSSTFVIGGKLSNEEMAATGVSVQKRIW